MESLRRLNLPLSEGDALSLTAGDMVLLDGEIVLSAGIPTHQRLQSCLRGELSQPRSLEAAALFHLGSFSRETDDGTFEVLYMNPTTSTRFNALMPELIRGFGLRAVGGKGGLDAACVEAMKEVGCVYFSFVGGGCPLLSDAIEQVISVDWNDLVAHYRLVTLRVQGLGPVTVGIDAHGNSLYEKLIDQARQRLPSILENLEESRRQSGAGATSLGSTTITSP